MSTLTVVYRDYSLPGSYRKIVVKPDNVSWEVTRYDNYHESLVESDFDRARHRESSTSTVEQTRGKHIRRFFHNFVFADTIW